MAKLGTTQKMCEICDFHLDHCQCKPIHREDSMAMMNPEQCLLLKTHGFQWYKDGSTDRVEPISISNVYPAANGFTVVYKGSTWVGVSGRTLFGVSELVCSTAVVERFELPENLHAQWIRIHWISITDERKAQPKILV